MLTRGTLIHIAHRLALIVFRRIAIFWRSLLFIAFREVRSSAFTRAARSGNPHKRVTPALHLGLGTPRHRRERVEWTCRVHLDLTLDQGWIWAGDNLFFTEGAYEHARVLGPIAFLPPCGLIARLWCARMDPHKTVGFGSSGVIETSLIPYPLAGLICAWPELVADTGVGCKERRG